MPCAETHCGSFSTIVFTRKYPFFFHILTSKPVLTLRLSYSNTHVFPQVHVKNLCANLAFGDNLILIPNHLWNIFMQVSSNPSSWSMKMIIQAHIASMPSGLLGA